MKTDTNFFKPRVSYKERYHQESLFEVWRKNEVLSILLDSSLISQTNYKFINIKLIDCGDYKEVYYNKNLYLKKDKNLTKMKDASPITVPERCSREERKKSSSNELKEIELKNINRSKFEMQRLVRCNEKEFKTFLTLTFADNVTSIEEANKVFNTWRTYIKRLKNDFKYIGVPEFQKRGAVHYHLLTNIDYNDTTLLSQEERKIWNKTSGWQIGKDVKGWSYGINMCKNMKDINVIAYLTKYMTKDIDNRLWGKRRYFYSQNLNKPVTYEFDYNNLNDFKMFCNLLTSDYQITYTKDYINFFDDTVVYSEFKKTQNNGTDTTSDNIYYVNLDIFISISYQLYIISNG